MGGDIHPNPVPLLMAVANVTSLRLHAEEVASWEVDVIFCRRQNFPGGGGEKAMHHFCVKRGWQCFRGCVLDTKGWGGYVEHPLGWGRDRRTRGPKRGVGEAPLQEKGGTLVWGLLHSTPPDGSTCGWP